MSDLRGIMRRMLETTSWTVRIELELAEPADEHLEQSIANRLMNELHRDNVAATVGRAVVRATVAWDARTSGGGRIPGPYALSSAIDVITLEVRRHATVARLRSGEVVADDVLEERLQLN